MVVPLVRAWVCEHMQANRVTHASGAGDDTESEAESDNEVCNHMNDQLAAVLVELAEAWTSLLESVPELQLEPASRRSSAAAGPAAGPPTCSRCALEQLESQACKVSWAAG